MYKKWVCKTKIEKDRESLRVNGRGNRGRDIEGGQNQLSTCMNDLQTVIW